MNCSALRQSTTASRRLFATPFMLYPKLENNQVDSAKFDPETPDY
jgi:hypothetical protein